MLHYIAFAIGGLAIFLLIMSAIAFTKARDVFTMAHVVMIFNCYVIPLILIAIELDKFSTISFIKIIGLIILNLVVTNLLCHTIVRRAILNNVDSQAKIYR